MDQIETQNLSGLKRSDFQTTIQGKETDLYVLRNHQGLEVDITNFGGAIVAIMAPDKNGNLANVIQGHDNIQDVINSPEPYLSRLIGRYGNRICKGKFQLNGKEYQLPINNGPNSLHGGVKGFNARIWDALMMNENTLILNYVSSYGEEGYSGEVKVTVAYTFNDENELIIDYMASTNKKTIINLTSHGYFSLSGIGNPTKTIDNLICQINADYYLPIDENSIPTG
ncbi:MAG: galactose-1-epimerase, partial [Prevotella sp.]|nr:galactose-1-epimerase [Prevotella sp.]